MEALIWETADELDQKLASRLRNIRKRRAISQQRLADMSGVSYGSIKRFEATGQISLLSLTNRDGTGFGGRAAGAFYAGSVQKY